MSRGSWRSPGEAPSPWPHSVLGAAASVPRPCCRRSLQARGGGLRPARPQRRARAVAGRSGRARSPAPGGRRPYPSGHRRRARRRRGRQRRRRRPPVFRAKQPCREPPDQHSMGAGEEESREGLAELDAACQTQDLGVFGDGRHPAPEQRVRRESGGLGPGAVGGILARARHLRLCGGSLTVHKVTLHATARRATTGIVQEARAAACSTRPGRLLPGPRLRSGLFATGRHDSRPWAGLPASARPAWNRPPHERGSTDARCDGHTIETTSRRCRTRQWSSGNTPRGS